MPRQFNPGDIYTPPPDAPSTQLVLIPTNLKEQIDEEMKKVKQKFPEITVAQLNELRNTYLHFINEFGHMPEAEVIKT